MRVQTDAILFNVNRVHSAKNNKDYNTLDFIIDGQPKKFFVPDEIFNGFLVNPVVKKFNDSGRQPILCKVALNIELGAKATYLNLEDIANK